MPAVSTAQGSPGPRARGPREQSGRHYTGAADCKGGRLWESLSGKLAVMTGGAYDYAELFSTARHPPARDPGADS